MTFSLAKTYLDVLYRIWPMMALEHVVSDPRSQRKAVYADAPKVDMW